MRSQYPGAGALLSALGLAGLLAAPAGAVPSFVREPGVRLSSAVLQAATGAAYPLRFYFIRGSTRVLSATTADGLAFAEEAGVRISTQTLPLLDIQVSTITGLSALPLTGGGFRMLYSVVGTTGAFRIYSATSADGLAWANDTGTRVDGGSTTFAGLPSLVKLGSGDWRLYYIQDFNGGDQIADRRVFTALSTNQGLNFGTTSQVLATQAGEAGASLLTDSKARLFITAPVSGQSTNTVISSVLSSDANATSFSSESGTRLSTTAPEGVAFPLLVRSTNSWEWRLYYNLLPPVQSTAPLWSYSAIAAAPDPQSLSPTTVFRDDGASLFTVKGEVFSTGPSAKLAQTGQTDIAGTGLTRADDQTITVTFNTQSKAMGPWNLAVTNANGGSGTLTSALLIDFKGGSIILTDNLMRPRAGTRAKVDVNVFEAGRVTVKLYTLDGQLVNTLLDQDAGSGTTTVFWDGKTAQGHTVASGVYVVHATGPKLNTFTKIVVIK